MKKILIILLSLVMCMGLMTAIFGCKPAESPNLGGDGGTYDPGEITDDEDLGEEQIQDFADAWEAFTYAKDRFENVEQNYITYMLGKSVTSGTMLGAGNGSQTIYNERYKSSKTKNFYFNTNCFGAAIAGIDPCMALKVYKLNSSKSYGAKIVYGQYNASSNKHGAKYDDESNKIVADFSGLDFINYENGGKVLETYGSDPVKLSVYVIDENTVKDKTPSNFQKLADGSYKFTFDFSEGVHTYYKTQVKAFSRQNYGEWRSTSITFTVDKFGRIKKLEGFDKYTMDVTGGATVDATTVEDFYYGNIPSITFNKGNVVADKGDAIQSDLSITFMYNGNILEKRKVAKDEMIGGFPEVPDAPSKEDYVLVGWFSGPNGTGKEFKPETFFGETADLTLYAYYRYNKFTVTFYNTDGSICEKIEDFKVGTKIILPDSGNDERAANPDYNFAGWFTQPDGKGVKYENRTILSDYSNLNLYAYYKENNFTLKFYNSNGELYAERPFKVGQVIGALPTVGDLGFSSADYNLRGWFTEADGLGTARTDTFIPSAYEDISLYAFVSYNKYTLTLYNSNGDVFAERQFTVGNTITNTGGLPTVTNLGFSSADYVLRGWYTEENGAGTVRAANFALSAYEDVNLYAFVSYNKYTLTFYNSDKTVYTSRTFTVGNTITNTGGLPTAANLGLSADYTLRGWYTEENGAGTARAANFQLSAYEDVNLYAFVSLNKYTLTFYNSDGSVYTSRTFTVGNTITQAGGLPTAANLELSADYNLRGWYTEENGAGTARADNFQLSAYEDVNLYAFVSFNKYTLTLYNSDGTVRGEPTTFTAGQTLTQAGGLPIADRANYDLLWFTIANGKGVQYTNSSTLPYADLNLYAQYKYNKHTVTFYDEHGTSIIKEATFKYGDQLTSSVRPADPSKSGHDFAGWFTQMGGAGTQYANNAAINSYDDINLYAYFTVQSTCVAEGTLITLADGSQKAVEDLDGSELLLVWNLMTGQFDFAPILFIYSSITSYEIIHLYFSDGTDVKVIHEHGFWDFNLNKYVFLARDAAQYIGHWFNKQIVDEFGELAWTKVQLVSVKLYTEYTTAYSPVTFGHLSYYVNGMLSMPGSTEGLINIFEVNGETMQIDQEKYLNDIETYGLLSYEYFADLIPEIMFEAFQGQYLAVSMGKGLTDWDKLNRLIEEFAKFLVE